MVRVAATVAIALLINAVSFLSAQAPPTSANISAAITVPGSIDCSAAFNSSLRLTGFNNTHPGIADIMLVLDESGSMDNNEFNQEKQFAVSLINAMITGPGATRVGIVQFDTDARVTLALTDVKATAINIANNMTRQGGSTCIGCGIQRAHQQFQAQPRPAAQKFMIVLTDGFNNVNVSSFATIITQAKNAGIVLIAVGVGAVSQTEIEQIASDIPGKDLSFIINDFNGLQSLVNELILATSSPGSTNVVVNLTVQPRFPVTGASATAGTVNVAGSSVVWTLPSLGADTRTLTLNHQHDGQGNGPLDVFNGVYTDTENHLVEIPTASTSVSGCNTAPVANAGLDVAEDLSGAPTRTISLNGGDSTDDGLISPLTYSWASDVGGYSATGPTPTFQLPFGTYNFTLTVSDGEFSDTDDVTVVVGDPTPPVITESVTGTLGDNGWYRSNVDVIFTASDPETGIASSTGCGTNTLATDTTGQLFTCTATNGAGASSSADETVTRDATDPILVVSGPVTVEATSGSGAMVTYQAPDGGDLTSGIATMSCTPPSGSLFGPGATPVSCSARDNAGNTTSAGFTVTVRDTTAPAIGDVAPSVSSLWPANHKMVAVTIAASATDTVSAATCSITAASSSEPDNGLGDGDTANDIVITGPLSVQLRAERAGSGPGRTYTITITCTDAAGNAATQQTTVSVPHSSR